MSYHNNENCNNQTVVESNLALFVLSIEIKGLATFFVSFYTENGKNSLEYKSLKNLNFLTSLQALFLI